MSGLKSRTKGLRREYELRDYLTDLGYTAFRVPLSGASSGFKGDVEATMLDKKYTFEKKARKKAFTLIYKMYYEYKQDFPEGIMAIRVGDSLIAISDSFSDEFKNARYFYTAIPDHKYLKVLKRIEKMKELLGTADYLVIQDDRKPQLFISYK